MSPAFMIAIANKQLTDNAAGRMLYFFHVRIDDDRSLRDHPRFAPWQPIRPINQQSNLGVSNQPGHHHRWFYPRRAGVGSRRSGHRPLARAPLLKMRNHARRPKAVGSAICTCAGVTILGARNFISPSYHIGFKAIVNTNGRIAARRLPPLGRERADIIPKDRLRSTN